jgi:hypothetical protein
LTWLDSCHKIHLKLVMRRFQLWNEKNCARLDKNKEQ